MGVSVVGWPCIVVYAMLISLMLNTAKQTDAALSAETKKLIDEANDNGPYLGVTIPYLFEMRPLLQSPKFTPANCIDFSGRRFRFGTIAGKKVILVMTGMSLVNAGIASQLLLSLFNIEGVVHYGIGSNANPSFNIADVVIPQYWVHSALWAWQRHGEGPEDKLPYEGDEGISREAGYIRVANYTVSNVEDGSSYDNLLNNIWYQSEVVFPVDGTPEEIQYAFWVAVDPFYYEISQKLENLKLENCLNSTTCLSHTPKVSRVQRGGSASILLDNAAYRDFLYNEFNISTVDMESAAVALICLQQRVPFIAIRALSDLAGGGSTDEANRFAKLSANNSVIVLVEFIKELSAASFPQSSIINVSH